MDNKSTYNQIYDPYSQEIDKYTQEIINQANGDYDYLSKWIENSYKLALGEDDQARAAFIKSVANDVEKKVGRIQFDYNTGKYRTEQDMATSTERTTQSRDLALKRLSEDEATTGTQMGREASQARQGTAESLSERGLLSGTLGQQGGLEGRTAQELQTVIQDKMSAFERTLGRDRQDITTGADQRLADIQRTGTRGIEDLTTGARRDAINTQNMTDKQRQDAQRARDAAIAQAEREKFLAKDAASKYARLYESNTI